MRRSVVIVAAALRSVTHRLGTVVAECNDAQRRAAALRISPDMYVFAPGNAPDTFDEFLFRTSGPLLHEPAAALRSGKNRS